MNTMFLVRALIVSLLLVVGTDIGDCLQCYECSTRTVFGSHDACSSGKTWNLRRVECLGPSVCASYMLTTEMQGMPASTLVNRGCQAIRYGATCEDIFNDLRRRGSVFPGHHECFTCSTDLCNSSSTIHVSVVIISISCLLKIKVL